MFILSRNSRANSRVNIPKSLMDDNHITDNLKLMGRLGWKTAFPPWITLCNELNNFRVSFRGCKAWSVSYLQRRLPESERATKRRPIILIPWQDPKRWWTEQNPRSPWSRELLTTLSSIHSKHCFLVRSYWITHVHERNPIGQTLELWVVSGWGKGHATMYATISGSCSTPQSPLFHIHLAISRGRCWGSESVVSLPVRPWYLLAVRGFHKADGRPDRTTPINLLSMGCAAESPRLWARSRQKKMNLRPSSNARQEL